VIVFCFLRIRREKGEDPGKGVSKTGYGVGGVRHSPVDPSRWPLRPRYRVSPARPQEPPPSLESQMGHPCKNTGLIITFNRSLSIE
jgi:hypothetical protein